MTLDERVDAILDENDGYRLAGVMLREEGWTKQRIADRLGVSRITVHRWTKPDYAQRGRAQRRAHMRAVRSKQR